MRLGTDGQFGDFVEGLGPGQLVGRQVLGSACLGEIQLGLYDRKGHLEVEVIRARGLGAKPGAKLLPGEYLTLDKWIIKSSFFEEHKIALHITSIMKFRCFFAVNFCCESEEVLCINVGVTFMTRSKRSLETKCITDGKGFKKRYLVRSVN